MGHPITVLFGAAMITFGIIYPLYKLWEMGQDDYYRDMQKWRKRK